MKNIKELQQAEAIRRMEKLNLDESIIKAFKDNNIVYYSERQNKIFQAVLYFVSNNPELEKKIKEFEKKYNSLVYHVQLLHTTFGDMYSFLYVSSEMDEWEMDWDDLRNNQCYANVWNADIEEIGMIGIQSNMGGVVRTW